MVHKLKQAVQGQGTGEEIDRILALPLTQVRLSLKQAFKARSYTDDQFADTIAALTQIEPAIAAQVAVARAAVDAREVRDALDIELDTPAKTALWAATLMRLMQDGTAPVADSRLWGQIQQTVGIFNEEIRVAKVISASLQNNDVSFSWGQPRSWFYYDPRKNHINLDLLMTLMMGFEHMRVVHLHEIGHSELSNTFPPRMRELYDQVKAVIDPASLTPEDKAAAKPVATRDEQRQMMAAVAEWNLRFQLWHMVEDNCVNQFAVNMEKILPIQDFAASWNHIGVALQGYGELARGDAGATPQDVTSDMPQSRRVEDDTAEEERQQRDSRLALAGRPLTDGEVADIRAGKISPEVAARMFHMNKTSVWLAFYERTGLFSDTENGWQRFKIFRADIDRTVDPSAVDGLAGFASLYRQSVGADGISQQQPRPSDRMFGPAHYRKKVETTSDARNTLMEEIWDRYLKPYADVLIAEQLRQFDQRQDNKNKNDDNKPQDLDGELGDQMGDMAPTPQDKKEKEHQQEQQAEQTPAPEGQENPGWENNPEAQGESKRAGDVKDRTAFGEDMTQEQKDRLRKAIVAMQNGAGTGQGLTSGTGAHEVDLSRLAKGDWRDFEKRALELSPVVNQVARSFMQIRERQKREMTALSTREHDFYAADGDFNGRLDRDKRLDRMFKVRAGRAVNSDDFKTFRADQTTTAHSSIEMTFMIDGSVSMNDVKIGGGVTAMEAALQSAAIMYLAARQAGIDAYIVMWGNASPLVVATPETDLKEVGIKLEGLRKGINSGTDLSPALRKTIATMAAHTAPAGVISGSSHIFVYSDGDIYDRARAEADLRQISRYGRNLTVDVAVFRPAAGAGGTEIEKMCAGVIKDTGCLNIGSLRGLDPNQLPREMAQTVLRRVSAVKVQATPDHAKRRDLKALYSRMTR